MILSPVKLALDFAPYLKADYSQHTGSGIDHVARECADIYAPYGGMPRSFCLANTTISQLWWTEDQINFRELSQQLDIDVMTVSTIKQSPGCVVPYHRDTFFRMDQDADKRGHARVRANIFMQDYRLGHFIQYTVDQQHHTSTHWQAGDGYLWDSDLLHLSANAGLQDKYTMQISGFYTAAHYSEETERERYQM